ncbi:riboflavin synthase [Galbitalea sp. SE-J8]|uniref:riboflavin synthase n=1 Tax=Galbitalea sp. SE-J8 TaxID=3054952 RepID=UPI00259CD4F2|nr:riboflavin synthase [Galbitalea sp. SE-J8]MDM4763630.1 riboflavin synthase [Galbitalea sp. SE-J8]
MFTGIIEEVGEVTAWAPSADAARITVRAPLAVQGARHGDSISVSGVCLTIVEQGEDWFTADVMAETSDVAKPFPAAGGRVNLERAAQVGDRLGGHIVQGHIDGTAAVLSIENGEKWRVIRFSLDPEHGPLVAHKGSIAIDGTSLTVSAVGPADAAGSWFEVSLIPETLTATTLGALAVGDAVNIETDILARHVERMLQFRTAVAGGADEAGRGSAGISGSAELVGVVGDNHEGSGS